VANKFFSSIKARFFTTAADTAVDIGVDADENARLAIDAGGKITWGPGNVAGDTNLYRDGENLLTTDDVFKASGGLITLSTDGAPTAALANGAIAIDTTNSVFYFRSDNAWNEVDGASIEIGDTPPASPEAGDLWFESDTGSIFVYYDSAWIEVGGSGGSGSAGSSTLDGLTDVVITAPNEGQVLKYDGDSWINEDIGGVATQIHPFALLG
jgi:hypothetical protein